MPIKERQAGDVTVIDVAGHLTIGRGDVEVRDAVKVALATGRRKILLNLAGVKRLDSGGVGELMATYASVTRQGGQLKLASLSPKVSRVLQVTQLVGVLESYDSELEALDDFAREA